MASTLFRPSPLSPLLVPFQRARPQLRQLSSFAAAAPSPSSQPANAERPAENPRGLLFEPPSLRAKEIKLLVCDMAGTTVHEGGLVYQTLQKVGGFGENFLLLRARNRNLFLLPP